MPAPITSADFGEAIPSANADFCDRFTKLLNVPQDLRDLFAWMFDADGSPSTAFKAEIAAFSAPTGTVIFSLTQNVGSGYLLCDGSEVSRATYAALFAAIGTRYGDGNSTTTFNLPDGRGRCLIGAGVGSGLSFRDINNPYVGAETHTLTQAEMPIHTHSWSGPATRVEERGDGANLVWRGTLADVTGPAGGGAPHANIQPSLVGWMFVKI